MALRIYCFIRRVFGICNELFQSKHECTDPPRRSLCSQYASTVQNGFCITKIQPKNSSKELYMQANIKFTITGGSIGCLYAGPADPDRCRRCDDVDDVDLILRRMQNWLRFCFLQEVPNNINISFIIIIQYSRRHSSKVLNNITQTIKYYIVIIVNQETNGTRKRPWTCNSKERSSVNTRR